jgi:hypothetical protein
MGIDMRVFNGMLAHPERWSLKKVVELAGLFQIDYEEVMDMVVKYYLELKKTKTSG